MPNVLVTGASRGIGAGLAVRFANEGWNVACAARTLAEGDSHLNGSLQATVDRITQAGGTAAPVVLDLAADNFDASAAVAQAEEQLGGPIDYLVNNAAAAYYTKYAEISAKRITIAFRVNVLAPWMLAQAVLPGMIERGHGSVLNISSQTACRPEGPPFTVGQINGATAYGGSKAWLERATVGGAAELQGTGVSLNTLSPEAAVMTEGAEQLVDLAGVLIEPVDTMAEASLALLTGDPAKLTGRVAYSLSILKELDRPVMDLTGKNLVEGWQPADFPSGLMLDSDR